MDIPSIPFEEWPKIPRLERGIVVTEKIDGTNASVYIVDDPLQAKTLVYAASRTRWITPASDNFGFARWVEEHRETLIADLGPGHHFGEWWGAGIGRRYGLKEKRLSLFNTHKWGGASFATPGLGVIPVLYEGPWKYWRILIAQDVLREHGSAAAPGFMKPEGIVVYHKAANQCFKWTFDGDGHKGSGK